MIGSDTALVSDDPRLRAVEGGTDEPVARVMGHMIGLMFGLTQSGDETNLMAGGTTGMALDGAQIERVRNALPADGVTRAPPADQFLVVPLRSYVLKSDIRALNASPELLRELPRIVAKINRIWSAAGIYFRLQDAAVVPCDDDAAHRAFASLDALAQSKAPREVLPSVVPASTRTTVGFRVYYVHDFVDNGVYPGKGDAFVRETAELVPVRGGIDEPLPRVTAHELGHGLGLGHQENRTHLMAEGTTGSMLGAAEVERARNAARSIPGTQSAEASGFLDEIRPLADRQMAPWSEAN
jgi:hypothetical protein